MGIADVSTRETEEIERWIVGKTIESIDQYGTLHFSGGSSLEIMSTPFYDACETEYTFKNI